MQLKIKICVLSLVLLMYGCNKQPQDNQTRSASEHTQQSAAKHETHSQSSVSAVSKNYQTQFEQSDAKISAFMDKLDDPQTPQSQRVRILCTDWPETYKREYMPALLHLKPNEFKQDQLLSELKVATDYYKDSAQINCP